MARDSTVAYVVGAITRQAGLRLSYETDNPLFAQRISVHMVKIPVMDALKTALKGKGLAAWLAPDGETIVIRPSNNSSAVRDRVDLTTGVVAGRVTDSASGKGIGGATVLVKGTALRATTVETGQFTIKTIPAGTYTLAVRSFGYKPQTVPVTVTDSERTTVNVALVPTPTVLSGVVTQVSGVQQRREVGADITVLNADSIMATAPVSTVTDLLETRVPGLTVLRQSGLPGAPRRLRLRGTSSIERSNDPILIVDGIRVNADQSGAQSSVGGYYGPSPIDQIDPNTIETIEVFKGPSASAMYGSDAGNGVIVITTKHGQAGRTRWNMRLDDGRSSLPSGGYPDNVFLFAHSIPGRRESISHLCLVGDYNCDVRDSLVRYQALNDPRFNVFGHGLTRQASLSVSGGTGSGTGALTYALTGSASSETGLFQLPAIEADRFLALHGFPAPEWMHHPDQYSTWGGTSRVDLPLSADGGHVALTSSYFQSQQQQGSVQGAIQQLLGRYVDTTQLTTHPLFPNYYTRAQLGTGTVTTGATLHWPVRTWLPLDATAGLNVGTNDNRSVLPSLYSVTQSVFGTFHQDSSGTYNLSQGQTVQQTLNGGTSLIVPAHGGFPGFKLPVGFNWTAQSAHGFSASTGNLLPGVLDPTQFLYGNNSGPTQSRQTTNTYGWYVVPTLDFGHGLYWNPGLRFDGGSASGTNAGFSLLPHLNLAWVAIDQPERPVLGAITLLRPRVAFGVAGVQPDPTSQYRLLTQTTATTPDGVTMPLVLVGSYGNTKLLPERSREFESGFYTELWNQRVSLTFDGYHKMRYNAIVTSPLAPSVGTAAGFNTGTSTLGGGDIIAGTTASYAYNVGTVRNSGVSATVGARVLDGRAVSWQMNANISKNNEQLVKLAPGLLQPSCSNNCGTQTVMRLVPGYPLNGIWARPIAGYVDANQNGRIDVGEVRLSDSAAYLGAPEPNYQLTMSTTLSFFNGRLSIITAVDYQNGLTQTYSAATGTIDGTSGSYSAFTSALNDPTTPLAQQAAIMVSFPQCSANLSVCQGSSFGLVQTVNTLRWQSLSVNYQIPPSATHWLRVGSMAVALQGSNLGLHTNYRGKDPNIGFTPGNNSVADTGQLPQPRLWQLQVTVGN